MNQLEEIKTFVQIVESGSNTAAADHMNIAASATSKRLKELEVRLGAPLIVRTTRRMSLTNVGKAFYKRCRDILDELEAAEDEVRDSENSLKGRLKIAVPVTFGVSHLTPLIAQFMHRHPLVRIELDLSDKRIDLLDGAYDLAIRIGALDDSTLIARRISRVEHRVCASPDFLNGVNEISHPKDLSSLPALCYSNLSQPAVWRYQSKSRKSGTVHVEPRLLASNGDALREAAIAGLGVLCEPSFVVHSAIKRGLLQPVLTQYRWYGMDIFVVYPKTTRVPRRTREFIDFLVMKFGDAPYWEA